MDSITIPDVDETLRRRLEREPPSTARASKLKRGTFCGTLLAATRLNRN